ncbi:MAG: methyltransferase domain-containing protein [Planctomycetota bacterium]|nr:MAG: methyltransferase domain-containing protein [Planctomycetota bacterium]
MAGGIPVPSTYEATRAAAAARAMYPAAASFALLPGLFLGGPWLFPGCAGAAVLFFLLAQALQRPPRLRSRPRALLRWSARGGALLALAGALGADAPWRLLPLGPAFALGLVLTVWLALWPPLPRFFPPRLLWRAPLRELLLQPALTRGGTERWVEVPWVLERLPAAGLVLDLGYAHADPEWHALMRGAGRRVYGADLAQGPQAGVRADLRALPFAAACFDLVLAVSTLEHVGCDNRRYGAAPGPAAEDGDLQAAAEIVRVLRPGGRALVTVPYGRAEHHGWFRQYDAVRLRRLLDVLGGAAGATAVEYFAYRRGWRTAPAPALAAARYGAGEAPAATGVACIELRR